jgi:putative ABC transport system permease protein
MVIAATGFFVALFNAVNERAYDIALMRSLGATRRKVVGFVLVEGLMLGLMGALLGLVLGHSLSLGVQTWIEQTRHMTLPEVGLQLYEGLVVLIALGISAVAAMAPSVIAYRVDVPQVLSEGS